LARRISALRSALVRTSKPTDPVAEIPWRDGRTTMRSFAFVAVLALSSSISCGDEERLNSTTMAATADETHEDEEVITDPVVPEGYEGDPNATLPLTPGEAAALGEAKALHELRNPLGQDPIDRGFATTRPTDAMGSGAEGSP
jgi:hypothetical protein